VRKRVSFVFIVLTSINAMLFSCVYKGTKNSRNLPTDEINLSRISDGSYSGNFAYGRFTYSVEVALEYHRIKNTRILDNGNSDKARKAEGVVPKVLAAQSIKVDTVSGATTTSKALLKATKMLRGS